MHPFLQVPEIDIFGFFLPWGLVIGVLGFLIAWGIVLLLQVLDLTRHLWNLPLFFAGLVILTSCFLGLLLAP